MFIKHLASFKVLYKCLLMGFLSLILVILIPRCLCCSETFLKVPWHIIWRSAIKFTWAKFSEFCDMRRGREILGCPRANVGCYLSNLLWLGGDVFPFFFGLSLQREIYHTSLLILLKTNLEHVVTEKIILLHDSIRKSEGRSQHRREMSVLVYLSQYVFIISLICTPQTRNNCKALCAISVMCVMGSQAYSLYPFTGRQTGFLHVTCFADTDPVHSK